MAGVSHGKEGLSSSTQNDEQPMSPCIAPGGRKDKGADEESSSRGDGGSGGGDMESEADLNDRIKANLMGVHMRRVTSATPFNRLQSVLCMRSYDAVSRMKALNRTAKHQKVHTLSECVMFLGSF